MSDTTRRALVESPWAIREDFLAAVRAALASADHSHTEAADDDDGVGVDAALQRGAQRGGGSGGVAVVPVQGVIRPKPSLLGMLFGIDGGSLQGLRRTLREAVADEQVGSIVLDVDSPGGLVDQVPETAAEIREAAAQKPIVAVANAQAASAAYWLASQATELYVTPSGAVGSIGVLAIHEEFSRLDDDMGITVTVMREGRFKAEANPFEPLTDEAREAIQADLRAYYQMFTGDVAKGRGVKADDVRSGFGEGRMVLAKPAVKEGMADRVGTLDDAVARAARLASGGARGTRAADDGQPVESSEEPALAAVDGLDLSKPWARELVRSRLPTGQHDPSEPSSANQETTA